MEGKTVAVTGCTSGTGLVLAKECARLGARVIMLNRESKRAQAALKDVQKIGTVELVPCDLSSFESVRAAAATLLILLKGAGLDVLCNNAGIMAFPRQPTGDGYDIQMQVNHFSHFLLTAEVFPLLQLAASQRGEARIVNHSSVARKGVVLEEKYFSLSEGNDLGGDTSCCFGGGPWTRYSQTKMANVVFTYALHERLKESKARSNIKVLVAHPGYSATQLQVTTPGMGGCLNNCLGGSAQAPEDGAQGILTCCLSPDVKSGQFWGPYTNDPNGALTGPAVEMPAEKLADKKAQDLLWSASEKSTGASFPLNASHAKMAFVQKETEKEAPGPP